MNYTIGLDLGTSSVKGVLLSANDTVAAEQSVKMHYRTNAGYIGFDADRFALMCSRWSPRWPHRCRKEDGLPPRRRLCVRQYPALR